MHQPKIITEKWHRKKGTEKYHRKKGTEKRVQKNGTENYYLVYYDAKK